MDQIRIGIVGYGNLGRGVEYALRQNPDMALVGVFTRRPPSSLTLQTPGVPVYPLDALDGMEGAVDVLLLCGGGHVSLETARLAHAAGFVVDVVDDRAEFADPRRFPMARRCLTLPASRIWRRAAASAGTIMWPS